MGKNKDIMKALAAFSQVSISVLSPIILCIILGRLATDKLGFPDFVMVIAIVLGAISGFYSMITFIKNITKTK